MTGNDWKHSHRKNQLLVALGIEEFESNGSQFTVELVPAQWLSAKSSGKEREDTQIFNYWLLEGVTASRSLCSANHPCRLTNTRWCSDPLWLLLVYWGGK